MVRVTNYFDTQVQVPTGEDKRKNRRQANGVNGVKSAGTGKMTDEQRRRWYAKVLESVRTRYRKLQRFNRCETYLI